MAVAVERQYNPSVDEVSELPDAILSVTQEKIILRCDEGWRGVNVHAITLEDVAEYYATQANNLSSGCRTLGSIVGDWRPINYLANMCLETFKVVNLPGLRMVSQKWGLIPKF